MNEIKLKLIKHNPSVFPVEMLGVRNFDFEDPMYNPIALSNAMQLFCFDNGYMGISANQLNIPLNIIYVMGLQSACFNPKIVDCSETQIEYEETLSTIEHPFSIKIKRPETIKVRYADAFGEIDTYVFTGLTARVFQRKIDVLNGVKLRDRVSQYHWDKAMKKYWNSRTSKM